jgi:hypothetical protein
LPRNDSGKHVYTQNLWKGFTKYDVEMGSFAMLYILNLIKTASAIQKLIGLDKQTQTHRQHGDLINLFLFQNKKSMLKI